MKKISILALGITLGVLSITACSKDSSSSSTDCCTLSLTFNGQTTTSKYCKKDANTITATINGITTDISGALLGGMTADQYMASQRTLGCK